MPVRFRVLPEALEEIRNASEHYRAISGELGEDFAKKLNDAIQDVIDTPRAWAKSMRKTRRRNMKRFPYSVIYREEPDHILIVAVQHNRRRPGYWRDRL